MLTATVITDFSSAHFLPLHKGKCSKLHGHNYKLEVTVAHKKALIRDNYFVPTREASDCEQGMVKDFSVIKSMISKVISGKYDHALLNDIIANPTAENIAIALGNKLAQEFELLDLKLVKLKLWETDNCFVEYSVPLGEIE